MNNHQRLEDLSPEEKRALLVQLLQKKASESSSCPPSFAQQRLWFLHQLEPDNPAYNIPFALRVTGPTNASVVEQIVNEIVRRHEVLRTTFTITEGHPVQVTAPTLSLTVPVVDLRELPESERELQVQLLATEDAQRPFDLARGPLLRATFLQVGPEEHVVLLSMHHIVFDGWSMGVLTQEMAALYRAFSAGRPSPLPDLPIQYSDFAVWQRQWLQGEWLEAQLSYWKRQLAGAPPIFELPTDRPRPAIQTCRGATQPFALPTGLSQKLKALSEQEAVSPFMTLLAAFNTLLYRYTGREDILVGTPIANRNRPEIRGLIGFFANTLMMRTDLSGNPSFQELLGRVREVCLGAYAHQDLPFEKLVEELQPERDLSRTPLFQVMFILQNVPLPPLEYPGLNLRPIQIDSGTAKFDLTLELRHTVDGLSGWFEYSTDLFDGATIARLVGHFQTLLEGIVAEPTRRLSELPLLTEEEQRQLLVEWNQTQAEYPDVCIHELFETQVEKYPDAVAAVFEDQQLTYRDLNRRANQLAHHLQKLGVGPEVRVGVCVERSLEMIIGLLGILKAGGAYVPLDPAYPRERLAFMLEDAQVPVLLTQQRLLNSFPLSALGSEPTHFPTLPLSTSPTPRLVRLDTDREAIAQESEANLTSGVAAENLAYVIYTSGSTGQPKGVAIEHHSTVARLDWARKLFAPEHLTGVLASTSICFDLSIFELFVPLSWGGKAILAENALHLPALPAASDVTLINTVPSTMAELLRIGGVPASVRTVNLAGEPLQNTLAQQVYRQETIEQVVNLYGPSEDTTYSTFALVKKGAGENPPIGRPITNTRVYVLDHDLRPVPVGVPGELHLAGDGLARGYLNRPELTAEAFIPDPFGNEPGARLYRTGDLARYRPDGDIEFIGRLDHQVKLRGFRVELGEIEAVLGQHPAVRNAVVLSREDVPGDRRLVAYVVPAPESSFTAWQLRRFLREKLPEHMIPSAFVMLDALPLTPNGKLDRKVLMAPNGSRPELEKQYVPPQMPTERLLVEIWSEVLGVERVGIHDNFFELGGHSLLMVRIHSKLQETLGRELSIIELFQHPTIHSLANHLSHEPDHSGQPPDRAEIRGARKASMNHQRQVRQKVRATRRTGGNRTEFTSFH